MVVSWRLGHGRANSRGWRRQLFVLWSGKERTDAYSITLPDITEDLHKQELTLAKMDGKRKRR